MLARQRGKMPAIAAQITQEVDDMVRLGEKLARDAAAASDHLGPDRVQELTSIAARIGQLIRRLYGPSSQYQANLERVLDTKYFTSMHSNNWQHVPALVGIVKGVQSDIRSGLLNDFHSLVQAEIFADFLEMAEHLLDTGFKDPAAVLLGGVLEDSLRKLAAKHAVSVTGTNGKPLTIDPINIALAKAGAYNALIQKQVTSWANLRNDAAHAKYSEYDDAQVRQMLHFVQKFCSDFLS
jgi:hypothetical protein